MKAFMVYMPDALYEKLRKEAYVTGIKMAEIARLALSEKLSPDTIRFPLKKKDPPQGQD